MIKNFCKEPLQSSLVSSDRTSEISRRNDDDIVSTSSLGFDAQPDCLTSGACSCSCCNGDMRKRRIFIEGFTGGSNES